MFVHTTIIKVNPDKVKEASAILFSEKIMTFYSTIQGLQRGYLIESVDEPGKLISLSFWDSMADARRTMSDPAYASLIGDLRSILLAAPERYSYSLLNEITPEMLQAD